MNEEKQNSDDCESLFKSVLEELNWFTKKQLLLYYDEKDIIPIIEQLEQSGVNIAKTKSFEFIRKFEENKIPKKQNFTSWMLAKNGRPEQPNGKI